MCGHNGPIQMFVVVEHPAGGVGCDRDNPGRWEGECQPGTEANACSDAKGEEGEYRFPAKYQSVLVQFALGFLISLPRSLW